MIQTYQTQVKQTDPDTSEPEDSGTPSDPLDIDNDGDGFSENQGDCDDTNNINPDASEILLMESIKIVMVLTQN